MATASAGPLRAFYGTPRDHVLGVSIVTGDGRLLHFGGRVVKNVAGYDMVRPIVGSYGSLGVITRVSVRLRPRPASDSTLVFAMPLRDIASAAARVDQAWPVAACEAVSPENSGEDWRLVVRLHGHPAEVREAHTRLSRGVGTPVSLSASDAASLWTGGAAAEASAGWHVRLTAPSASLSRTLDAAVSLAADVPGARITAHATAGIVRVWSGSKSHPDLTETASLMASLGGTCVCTVGDHLPPTRRDGVAAIESGIRRIFDPAGILPPFHT
jgi:glycolate oxidase FAD binding subunit